MVEIKVSTVRTNLTSKGRGHPDYARMVHRADVIKRIHLKANETIKMFQRTFSEVESPFAWVTGPLGAGETANLIDASTGQEMPYTVPQNYELEVLMIWSSLSQKVRMRVNLEGYLVGEYYLAADQIYYESEVKEMSTRDLDPTCSSSHTVRFYGTNLGSEPMHGYAKVVCILREHGTPKFTTKVVRCKWCNFQKEVPVETTRWVCPNCNKLNLYWEWRGR